MNKKTKQNVDYDKSFLTSLDAMYIHKVQQM